MPIGYGSFIPHFGPDGVTPPFFGGNPTEPAYRSPYRVTIDVFVDRFATTQERRIILDGLIEYRRALFQQGFIDGYQWLNGSFLENIEVTDARPPNDIDIVTLFRRPIKYQVDKGAWLRDYPALHQMLFQPRTSRVRFKCDTYPLDLDAATDKVVESVTYFFGLFSSQRVTNLPKGIVQIPLCRSR